jgi:hypothetical protein
LDVGNVTEHVEENDVTTTASEGKIPDSALAEETTELVRDCAGELLYHHFSRVYLFGAFRGQDQALNLYRELVYGGATSGLIRGRQGQDSVGTHSLGHRGVVEEIVDASSRPT